MRIFHMVVYSRVSKIARPRQRQST